MNGKGDSPRSCYSERFRDNFDNIDWNKDEIKGQRSGRIRTCCKRNTEADRNCHRDSKGFRDEIHCKK
jgi:hypothetical protein